MARLPRLAGLVLASIALAVAVLAAPTSATSASAASKPIRHVSIPALGISYDVHVFPCSRTRPPDDLVYTWGCAGDRNVYLLGHARSVFGPLHDAYVSGDLRIGMRVLYRDETGARHTYRVAWWRVTTPTPDAKWAWAPLGRAGMTLQTCVGRKDELRLMVRLYDDVLRSARFLGRP